MEWVLGILTIVFGGTSVVSVIKFLKYKEQNRRMMEAQAEQSEKDAEKKKIENERAMIDLGELYINKVKELGELINSHSDKNYDKLNESLIAMKAELNEVKEKIAIIPDLVEFLNGEFDEFERKKHHRNKKPVVKSKKNSPGV